MTAEKTLPYHSTDPTATRSHGVHHVNTPFSGAIPAGLYSPMTEAKPATGKLGSRRLKRLTETHEIRIRTTHRRRKIFTRGGVLTGFAMAMLVYPIMGNVVEYRNVAESLPGVVAGETPTTAHALLDDGPGLIPTTLDLPSVDDQAQALAVSSAETPYTISSLLPNCTLPLNFDGETNGNIPADHLCQLWNDQFMRADAALALAQMNEQFKAAFGRDLCIQQGYRSYAEQVRIKALRGYLAASPGTSMHGYGLAFDLCSGDDTGAPKAWLDANAATFEFINPDWAKFRKYEPWHWEYIPGVNATGLYGSGGVDGSGGGSSVNITGDSLDTATTNPPATSTTPPAETTPPADSSTTPPATPQPTAAP